MAKGVQTANRKEPVQDTLFKHPAPTCQGGPMNSARPQLGAIHSEPVSLYHTQSSATAGGKEAAESTKVSRDRLFDVAVPPEGCGQDSREKCKRTHQNTWAKILAGALFITAVYRRLFRHHTKEVACYYQSATIRTFRGHQRAKEHYRNLTMKFQMCSWITQMTLLMKSSHGHSLTNQCQFFSQTLKIFRSNIQSTHISLPLFHPHTQNELSKHKAFFDVPVPDLFTSILTLLAKFSQATSQPQTNKTS